MYAVCFPYDTVWALYSNLCFRGADGCAMPRESGPKPSVTLKKVLEGEISTFKEDNVKPWVLCLGLQIMIHPDTRPGCWRISWKA